MEKVHIAFHQKIMTIYGKHFYEWKQLWKKGKTLKSINTTIWLELLENWSKPESKDKSVTNSENRQRNRGGKSYVHNLCACSISSLEDKLVSYIFYFFKFFYLLINLKFTC